MTLKYNEIALHTRKKSANMNRLVALIKYLERVRDKDVEPRRALSFQEICNSLE